MKFKFEFDMRERYCPDCPLCGGLEDDYNCTLQRDRSGNMIKFNTWYEQRENCPLVGVVEEWWSPLATEKHIDDYKFAEAIRSKWGKSYIK